MKKVFLLIVVLVLLVGCAKADNITDCITDAPDGFWVGFWHGIIVLFSYAASLFNDEVVIYSLNNNGGWYDLGFILGLSSFTSGYTIKLKNKD